MLAIENSWKLPMAGLEELAEPRRLKEMTWSQVDPHAGRMGYLQARTGGAEVPK